MNQAILFNFVVDKKNNIIRVERSFDAPLDLVWSAWTESDILDLWWAPKPYRAVTRSMNFTEGGRWHYFMLGPEGNKHWCVYDFEVIKPLQHFSGTEAFCDENAVLNNALPKMRWENDFSPQENKTIVNVRIRFASPEDLETIIQMGFKEGFTAGLENLDQYISAQSH